MGKTSLFAIVAVLVVLAVAGIVFFLPKDMLPQSFTTNFVAPDAHYDYVPTLSNFTVGQPMTLSIVAQEKPNHVISSCRLSSYPTNCGADYSREPWCQSKTILNARSIRIAIDRINVANSYYYPNPEQAIGYSLSTSLSAVTPDPTVCCWGYVGGACSVCADQERYNTYYQRAYVFQSAKLGPGQTINGANIFNLTIISPSLAPGQHILEVDFLAETQFSGSPSCGNANAMLDAAFSISGTTGGDQNTKTNTHLSLPFFVANNTIYISNTVYLQNNTQISSLQAQLDGVNAQLANSQNLSASQISALQNQQMQLTAQINALTAANLQLAQEKAALEAQVQSLSGILAATQANLTATQATVVQLQQIIQTTNDSLNTAQASITLMLGQITDLKNTIVQTQAQLDAARLQLADVTAQYNAALAQLETAKNAQIATEAQLKSTLSDLTIARDANVGYRLTLDNYSFELQQTHLLTDAQTVRIIELGGVALAKEQIANQSLALAAQKESEAQAALNEVVRIMAENQARSDAFNLAMQELQANLSSTSTSLSVKIEQLNQFSMNLQAAQAQAQNASDKLEAANIALSERQAALAKSQADVAVLQQANQDLKEQLASEQANVPVQMKDWLSEDFPSLVGISLIAFFVGFAAYYIWGRK